MARLLLVLIACSFNLGASFNAPRDATWTRRGLPLQKTRARMADEFRWRRAQREARMEVSSEDEKLSLSTLFNAGALKQVLFGAAVLVSASGFAEKLPRFLESPSGNLLDIAIDAIVFAAASSSLAKSFGIIGGVDYAELDGLDKSSLAQQAGEWASAGEVPTLSADGKYEVATFAGGCFWGTELHFQRYSGVVATCVGYTQGNTASPSYEQVCGGSTGHTEGIQLIYDPAVVRYETLCKKLLTTVDATLRNQVGNDRGSQYRHGIYPHSEAQREVAEACLSQEQTRYARPVVTEVKSATVFFPAENYHQRYLQKGGQSAEKNAPAKVRCYG